jgi:hypothetical protein
MYSDFEEKNIEPHRTVLIDHSVKITGMAASSAFDTRE